MIVVVADTSPLNYLIQIECQGLLPALFERVFVPTAVVKELNHLWGCPQSYGKRRWRSRATNSTAAFAASAEPRSQSRSFRSARPGWIKFLKSFASRA